MHGPGSELRESTAHWILAVVGPIFGTAAIAAAASTIVLTSQLPIGDRADELAFRRVFSFSIVYLSYAICCLRGTERTDGTVLAFMSAGADRAAKRRTYDGHANA
jgi:hypothetical protein